MEVNNAEKRKRNIRIWKKPGAAFLLALFLGLTAIGTASCGQEPQETAEEPAPEPAAAEEPESVEEEEPEEEAPAEEEPEQAGELQALIDMGVPIPEKEVDFEDLQENVNEDIYAWIYIPDSKIDYPIVQHPIDNFYYLNYNLDGSYGYPGCIYTERYNRKDFADPLTVVYGHNMKNGTMFAGLHDYEDIEYFREHPYVYVYTPEKLFVYEVFASHEYGNEHLLYNHDYAVKSEFKKYVDSILELRSMNSNRAEEVEVTEDSHILVLSTCMANKPDNRYLVQGVLLNED